MFSGGEKKKKFSNWRKLRSTLVLDPDPGSAVDLALVACSKLVNSDRVGGKVGAPLVGPEDVGDGAAVGTGVGLAVVWAEVGLEEAGVTVGASEWSS